jgi:hypothetical protein
MVKYETTDVANAIFPLPVAPSVLEMYGNVISGKINEDAVKNIFIKVFLTTDLFRPIVFTSY